MLTDVEKLALRSYSADELPIRICRKCRETFFGAATRLVCNLCNSEIRKENNRRIDEMAHGILKEANRGIKSEGDIQRYILLQEVLQQREDISALNDDLEKTRYQLSRQTVEIQAVQRAVSEHCGWNTAQSIGSQVRLSLEEFDKHRENANVKL